MDVVGRSFMLITFGSYRINPFTCIISKVIVFPLWGKYLNTFNFATKFCSQYSVRLFKLKVFRIKNLGVHFKYFSEESQLRPFVIT